MLKNSKFRNTLIRTGAAVAGVAAIVGLEYYRATDETSSSVPVGESPVSTPDLFAQAEHETALNYLHDQSRNQRLAAVAHRFGAAVLEQYYNPASTVGNFEVHCWKPHKYGPGFKLGSKGYTPQPGDNCSITHNKTNGGMAVSLELNTTIDNAGHFDLNRINWLNANNMPMNDPYDLNQAASLNYGTNDGGGHWEGSAYFSGATHFSDIQPSIGGVDFVDNYGTNYLTYVTKTLE